MIRILVLIAVVLFGAALLPPFFTHGACDAEFDQTSAQLQDSRRLLGSPDVAAAYFWRSANLPVRIFTAETCRRSKPSFVESCGSGELLFIKVPVRNPVCRIYRDSDIRIQLQYSESGRLSHLQSDMKPYKYLHLPWLGIDWYWGK
jgi:hypothetical protein